MKSETTVFEKNIKTPSHTQPAAVKRNSSERSASGEGKPVDLQIAQTPNATPPQDRAYLNFTHLRSLADIAIKLATCCCKNNPSSAIHDSTRPNQHSNHQPDSQDGRVSQIMSSPVGSIGLPDQDSVPRSRPRTDTMEKLNILHLHDTPPLHSTSLSTILCCDFQNRTSDQDPQIGKEAGVIKIAFPSEKKIQKLQELGKDPIQYIQYLQTLHKNEVTFLEQLKKIPDYDRFFVTHRDACMSQKLFATPEVSIHAYTMQKYLGGDLADRINDLSHRQIIDVTIVILGGLCKLKEARIIHRDLKPENIFLDSDNRPRISDFGLSAFRYEFSRRIAEGKAEKEVGTLSFQAPEVTQGHKYHEKYLNYPYAVDMFSLGATLYTLLNKEPLPSVKERLDATPTCQFSSFDDSISAPQGKALVDFINECLSHNPSDRPFVDSAFEDFKRSFEFVT